MKLTYTEITGAVGAVAIVAVAVANVAIQWNLEDRTINVDSKERLASVSGDGESTQTSFKNFVYADGEAYVVKDSLWNWHFRARTVYAEIPQSGECLVTLSGVRAGFLSMHKNIISAECAPEVEQ